MWKKKTMLAAQEALKVGHLQLDNVSNGTRIFRTKYRVENLSLQLLVTIFCIRLVLINFIFIFFSVISTQTDIRNFGRMTSLTRSFSGDGIQILYIPLFFQER